MASPHHIREQNRSTLVNHDHAHPNETIPTQSWSQDQTLHVAAVYSNPCRWRSRRELFNNFRRHMESLPNVRLYVGELAYGDRPFEVTTKDNPDDLQLRTREVLWHKENLLNLVINRFDAGWEYGAISDGDFHFSRHDVALETIHQLQRYDWVQMYSTYSDLSPTHKPMRLQHSFAFKYATGQLSEDMMRTLGASDAYGSEYGSRGVGTTGGCWAFRRESFDAVGGLLDTCILGSGDWHMAFGVAGAPDSHPNVAELTKCGARYAESIKVWQARASAAVRRNVGFVNCHALHYFHGSKKKRGYGERWKILRDNDFNPHADIYRDSHGVWQLNPNRIKLRDDVRRYFDSRSEDDPGFYGSDRELPDQG